MSLNGNCLKYLYRILKNFTELIKFFKREEKNPRLSIQNTK